MSGTNCPPPLPRQSGDGGNDAGSRRHREAFRDAAGSAARRGGASPGVWVRALQSLLRMPPKLDNKVIARFLDGTLVRGVTLDFNPAKAFFHVDDGKETRRVNIGELKALFFVRDLVGNPEYQDKKGFFTSDVHGKKIMVEFRDGETLFGFTLSYTSRGLGFFVFPGDPDSNNEKVFIVHGATRRIKLCSPTDSFIEPSSAS